LVRLFFPFVGLSVFFTFHYCCYKSFARS